MTQRADERSPPEPAPRARRPQVAADDATLVARACAGDRWAEDAIYRRHAPAVTRLCSRLLGRRADADDVVQDTFVVAFEKLASLRAAGALRTWLLRIAVQRTRRKLRTRRWLVLCGLGQPEDLVAPPRARDSVHPELRLELEAMNRVLCQEAPELRLAWLLHRVEELSIQETADTTGKSVATIKRYVAAVDARIERANGGRDA